MDVIEVHKISKKFRKITGMRKATTLKSFLLHDLWKRKWNSKEYIWALKDVEFKIKENKTVAIIGRNGSGKSTLLKLMSRILKPDEGTIKIRGRVSSLIELGAGFHPELSGRENVIINGIILGFSKREIKEKFDEIVQFAELEEFIDEPVRIYSSGMHIRLGFSVAVHVDPDILLIDEVLTVGDAIFVQKCMDKMNEFKRRGKTIVLVTHDLELVKTWCDEAIWLHDGVVKEIGKPEEIVESYRATFSHSFKK
jgi:lipopolysaccharide transport system ATP-binding protein